MLSMRDAVTPCYTRSSRRVIDRVLLHVEFFPELVHGRVHCLHHHRTGARFDRHAGLKDNPGR